MEVTNETDGDMEDVNMASSPTAGAAPDRGGAGGADSAQEPASKRPTRGTQLSNELRGDSADVGSELDSYAASSNPANTASSNSSATPASGASEAGNQQSDPAPPIDQQVTIIRDLSQVPLTEGMVGYVISNQWLQDAQERAEGPSKAGEEPLPPVDMRPFILTPSFADQLVNELGEIFYPLKPGLTVGGEIEVLPRQAWDKIIKWHGLAEGSPMVRRFCHNTSSGPGLENLSFEMYPPVFTIMKLPNTSAGLDSNSSHDPEQQAPRKAVSRSEPYEKVLKEMKDAANIPAGEDVRVWRVLASVSESTQQSGMITPAQSRSNSPAPNSFEANLGDKLVLDVNKFLSLQEGSQRERLEVPDSAGKPSSPGVTIDEIGLGQEGVLILEQRISGPAGGEWVSDSVANKASKFGIKLSGAGKSKSAVSSGRTSPAPGIQTRGRTQRQGRARGTVGLANLGNTCYMNSALQCVKSVKELTSYMLGDKYVQELNPSNPLAHNGDVAKAYAELVKQLFAANGSSFSPRQFKNIIGRYGPSFSGYGQQDSQEFLLFLLDGLQEDLNRIHKKPYIEKPDSTDEMVHDEAALKKFADRCWEIYKARNDSVITDLFAGMYKSTVKCPVCDKVSIIFDPFNNLTLQLPIENAFTHAVRFYPLNLPAVDIEVDIDKNATFAQLKEYIGQKVSVNPKRLVLAETYKSRFFKMYNERQSISEDRIQSSDHVCCFELEDIPTNYPPSKSQTRPNQMLDFYSHQDDEEANDTGESDTANAAKILVPIFHRAPKEQLYSQREILEGFADPTYIILSREETKDEEAILRKILAKVATMTTKDILEQGDESDGQGSDTVVLTRDDADSSADSKVQAHSVQSEEGIVDVSMKDSDDSASGPRISYPPPPKLRKPLPTMLQSTQALPAQFKNLFQLKYCNDGSAGSITTGWTAIGDGKTLPALASRVPKPPKAANPQLQTAGAKLKRRIKNGGSGGESSEEEEPENAPPAARAPSMQSSATSDEDEAIQVEQLSAPAEEIQAGPQLAKSTRPLIRPGEGIVCDWTSEAYNALFGESASNDEDGFRGAPAWTIARVTLPDPEVDRKRQIRNARKKDGVSLSDCLEEFGKEEILSENDAWYCPRCKEHRRASKKFELWKAPDILVIHLKRFSAQGRLRDKLDVTVDFPTEGLDLSSRVAVHEEGKELLYDLFAVDNHYGGLGGGHYTAFAQSYVDGQWYEYNDSIASRVNPSQAVTRAAYLLFYRRRSDTTLGGPFFENLESKAAAEEDTEGTSSPQSRTQSPSQAGEGRRLDDFSRTGSSSAYQGAGAGHQAGSGGRRAKTMTSSVTDLDDELPTYSDDLGRSADGMDLDEPSQGGGQSGAVVTWNGFGTLGAGDEDDDRSTGVSSTGAIHDDQDSVRSVASDNGLGPGTPADGMPGLSAVHGIPEVNISAAPIGDAQDDDLDDPQVAEVRLESDDAKTKSE